MIYKWSQICMLGKIAYFQSIMILWCILSTHANYTEQKKKVSTFVITTIS